MDGDTKAGGHRHPRHRQAGGEHPRHHIKSWIPTVAVVSMALVAVATTVVVTHTKVEQGGVEAAVPAGTPGVVRAPPLVVKAPALNKMGAAPACRNCGVVQTIVARRAEASGPIVGYLMEIKMDDGSLRTVEQRGALPAGSRVVVDGNSVTLARR